MICFHVLIQKVIQFPSILWPLLNQHIWIRIIMFCYVTDFHWGFIIYPLPYPVLTPLCSPPGKSFIFSCLGMHMWLLLFAIRRNTLYELWSADYELISHLLTVCVCSWHVIHSFESISSWFVMHMHMMIPLICVRGVLYIYGAYS